MSNFLFSLIFTSVLSLTGCHPLTEPTQPQTAVVEVTTQFAGSCGAVPSGGQCDTSPTPASEPLLVKRLPDKGVVAELIPDSNGFVRQNLPVGNYQLELKNRSSALSATPVEIKLSDNQVLRVTFTILALRP